MATCSITINYDRTTAFLDTAMKQVAAWPDDKRLAFIDHWNAMQANGCQPVETLFRDGVMHVAPSDDLRRAFMAFGVVVG